MRNLSRVIGFIFAPIAILATHAAPPATPSARLLRHPTYHKGRVAFSYLGDIWIANENGSQPQRLTDHQARDIYPRFSPDGSAIAFSSNRDGNYNVYAISTQGGKPRQLTFHSADDTVVSWTPNGRKILFVSSRNKGVFPTVSTLFEIPADGGMEQSLPTDWGSSASYSSDGTKLAFTRHPGTWSRQHYRGNYAVDLWIMNLESTGYQKLGDADYKGNYLWPMYGSKGDVYFVADRLPNEKEIKFNGPEVMKSVNNIWKISDKGGTPVQVTHHTSGQLFFPTLSADGKTIVYEENFGLWKLDVASGKSTEIRVDIKSDMKDNEIEWRAIQGEADAFSLSPSTKRAAISTHGEIFSIATDRGESQKVTETPWREQNPRWSPDGKWIAFVSDRTGREEIWIADERGRTQKQLSDVDCDKSSITWAPDSKSLLWPGSDKKLRRVYLDSGRAEEIADNEAGAISNPQFSPDGKWISYSKPDSILRSHVYIKNVELGEERAIGAEDFLIATGARWTPDGKKLLLLGGVGAPSMASLNRTTTQLYSVALTRIEKNPDDRDIDSEEQAQGGDSSNRRGRAAESSTAATKADVKIEWDGLDRRIRRLTRLSGGVTAVVPSPDSRTYAFIAQGGDGDEGGGRPALYTIAEDGSKLTAVAQGTPPEPGDESPRGRGGAGRGFGDPQWAKDGRSLFYRQGSGIYSVSTSAASSDSSTTSSESGGRGGRGGRGGGSAATASTSTPSSTPRRVNFTVRLEIDEQAERRQVFQEAWRVMKNRFYDPEMHGVDWAAARETYAALLPNISDNDELHSVIMQMIGELNASHTGISGGGPAATERLQTLHPGFDLEADPSGYYKVAHVYKKGPADHDYVHLAVGNYILAVNGKDLRTPQNYWRLFNLIPGRKFDFTVNSQPEMAGSWNLSLEPISATAQADLEYERWVDQRREMVSRLSSGQIGYLHIRAMNAAALQKFQRDLLDNHGKQALIIDERFNGGGGIDQELLAILNQRVKYQSWRGRGSVEVPRPVQTFYGPLALLQNERSASDAEMFPDGFRKLGLGKIIGVQTMGAVIGTGAYRLMDGSSIRTPGFGVFTAAGENLENYGVQPDILADNTPADFAAGRDRQIEKAIEVLQDEITASKR